MSGYWNYGSEGHRSYCVRNAMASLDIQHQPNRQEHIDELVIPFINFCWRKFGASSVWSCEGHPNVNCQRGYITWIFEDQGTHMRFLSFMNQLQVWMRMSDTKAHAQFKLESDPLYHETTEYDTMAMPALTMRTMEFHNMRICKAWWAKLTENAKIVSGNFLN